MTRFIGPSGSGRRRRTLFGAFAAFMLLSLLIIPNAFAVHDEEFQLDPLPGGGNTVDNTGVNEDFDWESFFNATGPGGTIAKAVNLPDAGFPGFTASGGRADFALPDPTTYATGSKDTLPIQGGWQCSSSNNVGDKVDIVNAYATSYIRPDNHLILYYGIEKSSPLGSSNIATWFLKDGTVDCTSPGGATNFTGVHTDGDILLVSAFTNGGDTANVSAYRWNGNDATGSLGTTPIASGGLCGTGSDDACSVVNRVAISPPWAHPDKNGGALDAFEFFEGGVDVGVAGTATCFATAVMNTRSSASLTATLFDYARFSLPVCGELSVKKYIDVDMSGTKNNGDVTSGAAVGTWAFTVTGPGADTTVRCSGTTDNTGTLVCTTGSLANLTPGTYTITETQKTGFFNTDAADNTPDPNVSQAATVAGTVTVGVSGTTANFGNTCFVDKTFQINNVPAGVGEIKVDWSVASGTHAGDTGTVTLTGTTTRTGTQADTFNQTDTIDWSWYLSSTPANKVTGGVGDSLAGGAYPTCADTNQANFPTTTISGFKYKDVNNDGDFNAGDLPGAGFTFQLKSGPTVLQTAVSNANGNYTFAAGVAPGTYTIHEVQETGWRQTEPNDGLPGVDDRTVTVVLGQATATVGDFGNHPLSDISASFSNQAVNPGTTTPATQATITCDDGSGSQTGNEYSATGLPIGTYHCTIVITDP